MTTAYHLVQICHTVAKELIRANELDQLENSIRNVIGEGPSERQALRDSANIVRAQALDTRQRAEAMIAGSVERALRSQP